MNRRAAVAMTDQEVAALLREQPKLQLGTINPDGTPHLVTMFYGLVDVPGMPAGGEATRRIAFWTYRTSQKIRNIERDPRVSCLVEAGVEYAELRGALIYGRAKVLTDQNDVRYIGGHVLRRMMDVEEAAIAELVEATAAKRYGVVVEPVRVASWDHGKLT
jgi:nitroimidazol reductase NimA-like FMN-containing flavoprotein (pyridoxamine 5'-phosphate oxidase superfamily)